MEFTYSSYQNLIRRILRRGYQIADYHNYSQVKRPCILRHDVDMDMHKAADFAEREAAIPDENGQPVRSTYFVLISSDFYNPYSYDVMKCIKRIRRYGHEIGLHFDEKRYDTRNTTDKEYLRECVEKEVGILSEMLGERVSVVSMHRPSDIFLKSDISFRGRVINSYGTAFFRNFKYMSDSRMLWRENVEEIVESRRERALHILTHPFWYSEARESMQDKLRKFAGAGNGFRYACMEETIRDLESVLGRDEV